MSVSSVNLEPVKVFCRPGEFKRTLIGEAEKAAALAVIDRAIAANTAFDRYSGEEVDAYEKEFAEYMGTQFAAAVSSGSAAVHSALSALQLEPGDEVVCPPVSDPGGISPVLYNLCIPVFADSAPETFNVCAEGIKQALSDRTRAIIVAHIAGEPCDMDAILQLAARHGLPVIEDAAQAHDATWNGRKTGSMGTLGAFSLMSGKHHTSGGQGGMVTTNDEALYWRVKSFADRGKAFGRKDLGSVPGLNYRMTELEAAIGRVQLRKLSQIVSQRQALVARLEKGIAASRLFALGKIPAGARSAYWFLRMRVQIEDSGFDNQKIASELRARGLRAAPTYTSIIYKQPWFVARRAFGNSGLPWSLPQCGQIPDYENCCPNAESALASHLLMSFNESLSEATVDRMAEAVLDVERCLTE